jgi:hypothetical protein
VLLICDTDLTASHNLGTNWSYGFPNLGGYQSVDKGTLYLLSLLYIFLHNQFLRCVEVNFLL